MHDLAVFAFKLCLYVCTAIGSIDGLNFQEYDLETGVLIASIQMSVGISALIVYMWCRFIVRVVSSRKHYKEIGDRSMDSIEGSSPRTHDEQIEDQSINGIAGSTPRVVKLDTGKENDGVARNAPHKPDENNPNFVIFESSEDLSDYIVRLHFLGLLLWSTTRAFDYSQPILSYCFTVGLVVGCFVTSLFPFFLVRRDGCCGHSSRFVIFLLCCSLLVAVKVLHGAVSLDKISCFVIGISWTNSWLVKPKTLLFVLKGSLISCVLLCYTIISSSKVSLILDHHDIFTTFMVQPVLKFMCIYIMCLSIHSGHTTDLMISLSVASCSQFVYSHTVDVAYLVPICINIGILLVLHTFMLCGWDKKDANAGIPPV